MFENKTIQSLSHVFDPNNISVFPDDPQPVLNTIASIESDGYRLHTLYTGEHTGTHWGAPNHFNLAAASADQLDPQDFFLPGVKLDIRDKASIDKNYAVTINDLVEWQDEYGEFPRNCAVILHTGWDEKWGTADFYSFDDDIMNHPGFSLEAVEWLIEQDVLGYRGALGTDAFSPDLGINTSYSVSQLLYQEHRLSLELLANLDKIPASDFSVIVGGMIIRNGTGSPATIYAVY